MKLLPKKYKKRFVVREYDDVPLTGKKGGRVKKQLVEAKMVDKELQNYAYR